MDDYLVPIGSPSTARDEEDTDAKKKKFNEDSGKCELSLVKDEEKERGEEVVAKKTGKEKRRKKRMKNEPQSFIGLGEGPPGVNVLDFVEARATELRSMLKALESKGGGKRVFQYLPTHMRRRAMSHNAKRLPRRLREQASKQIDEATKKKKPPPSRKQRRKPSCLRREYSRRQRENVWLETHIWHAKRMKMSKKYGLCIAEHCNDKGVRAAYRSLIHGCLLSDMSYYQCNEVSGQQSDIIFCLSDHFDTDAGLTIKAKPYLKGQRECRAILYKAGAYPYGAIAPVHFLWQAPPPPPPEVEDQDEGIESKAIQPLANPVQEKGRKELISPCTKSLKLWIWCHPASQKQVLSELLKSTQSYNKILQHQDRMTSVRQEVSVVQRNLVRFRLLGPRSHAVLMETLKPKFVGNGRALANPLSDGSQSEESLYSDGDEEDDWNDEESGDNDHVPALLPAEKWWLEGELKDQVSSHAILLTKEYPAIKVAAEPAQFARGSVIGICVEDPRLFTPYKKTDMVSSFYPRKKKLHLRMAANGDNEDEMEEVAPIQSNGLSVSGSGSSMLPDCLPTEISFSPLWNNSVSNTVSRSLIPCHLLNRHRSRKVIRSSILKLGDSAPCIPVLLIQQTPQHSSSASRSASSREYTGAGWDLILPPEWAMAFWISLIYRGARACGMKELAKASLESQVLHFPQDFPDTVSGKMFYLDQQRKLEAHFSRRPPAKRLNYGKLVVPTPFYFPWEDLVRFCDKLGGRKSPENTVHVSEKKVKLEDGVAESLIGSDSEMQVQCHRSTSVSENVYAMTNQSFYVLRSKDALFSIRLYISTVLAKKTQSAFRQRVFSEDHHKGILQSAAWKYAIDDVVKIHGSALVAVKVELSQSGNLAALDSLSLPTPADLQSLLKDGVHGFSGPTEEMNQRGVTVVEKGTVITGISSLTRNEMKEKKKMRKVSSDGGLDNFRIFPARPSRLIFGYVTSAGYRLTASLDSGIGFVSLAGLIEAVTRCHMAGQTQLQVLARGAKTKYYFVKLEFV